MDRHDIDALLVGALYGELTPADEARLTAHLESHPADRGALDDLKSARAKVRESRIFDLQAEPPQHISALLLQEAHRRAPKKVVADDGEKRDSWFWRFARSFALHPAMAAAAMLVVVLGVSAVVYKNNGGSAMREASPPAATQSQNEAMPTEAPVAEGADQTVAAGSAAPSDSYHAGLAEKDDIVAQDPSLANERKKAENAESAATRWRSDDGKAAAPAKNQGITVTTEQMQPKDLESEDGRGYAEGKLAKEKSDEKQSAKKSAYDRAGDLDFSADDNDGTVTTGAAPGRAAVGGASGGGGTANGIAAPQGNTAKGNAGPAAAAPTPSTTPSYAQPPPPPPSADKATTTAPPTAKPTAPAPKQEAKAPTTSTATGAKTGSTTSTPTADANKKAATQKPAPEKPAEKTVQKAPPKTVTKTPAPAQQAPAAPPVDPTIAWAKQQHAQAVSLANKGDCPGAAKVALGVSQRAPAYYASFMASDRQLKSCKTYIDDARDREAEKSAKSRAQKRVNADEPAAPAESVK